ncbi:transposase [Faecalibacterium prausnitzii]|uniref:IS3 family transposase n=1 Tax=Faecalibacterium prausnitzii TaxID=853 RepID=UPI002909971E|nr:IS3 family transposase [Faecalibacterium prausnitzii]MDU8656559.1 IS3 family transposase [Faecalibacterium prausnitzii]
MTACAESSTQSLQKNRGITKRFCKSWSSRAIWRLPKDKYQHAFYRNELQKHGIIQSMSRKGNCYDNCIMETFFGRLKNEMFYGFEKDYPSFEAFSKAIADYIDYYNNSRIQAKTKWMSPSKFREASMMEA